jgi:hypothetical protein
MFYFRETKMPNDFSAEYSERSDDELLHLASERHSLTPEATAALDAELRRRNLTESDRLEHQRTVKRYEQREARKHRRYINSSFLVRFKLPQALAALIMLAVLWAMSHLPVRYQEKWGQTIFTTVAGVVIAILSSPKTYFRGSGITSLHWAALLASAFVCAVVSQLSLATSKKAQWRTLGMVVGWAAQRTSVCGFAIRSIGANAG